MAENQKTDEIQEIEINSILVLKASKKLAAEIENELNEEDPDGAKVIISKNRVINE